MECLVFIIRKYTLTLSSCFILVLSAYSQDNQFRGQVVPPSPEVSALAKFADVQVSKSSGIPNISLPLYKIPYGEIDLLISLMCHNSGVRVEERAGWVGIGWALNAGGVITRTGRGIPDESTGGQSGYMAHTVNPENLSQSDLLLYYNRANNQEIDFEQDIFHYSFGNYAGKFVLDKNGKAIFLNASNLKINFAIQGASINSWTVVDTHGNKYVFSEVEQTIVEPLVESKSSISYHIFNSSWHLNKIITYRGREIDFIYTSYEERFYRRGVQSASYFDQGASGAVLCGNERITDEFSLYTIRGKQLNKIKFDQGEIVFQGANREDSSSKRLTGVVVKNRENLLIKSFELQHDYFESTLSSANMRLPSLIASITPTKRLRLKALIETTSQAHLAHSFFYDGNSLPHLFSNSQDHWGYYNGAFNQTLIPQYFRFRRANADRTTNPTFSKLGSLKSISFPTGGSITYEMEGNQAALTLKDYYDYFSPVQQESDQPMYSVTVNHNTSVASISVEPQIHSYDSLKRMSYTISFPLSLNCDTIDRNCIGSVEVSAMAEGGGHFVSMLNGKVVNGQIHGFVNLKAGLSYNVRIRGRSTDTYGISASLRGFKNPALSDETGLITANTGGLRVKEIIKDFNPGIERIKYEYKNRGDNNSSGTMSFFPKYDFKHYNLNQNVDSRGGVYFDLCSKVEIRSISQIPLGTSGSFFAYSNVKEVKSFANEVVRSDYGFYTAKDYSDQVRYSFPFGVIYSFENRRGTPKDEVSYTYHNQTFAQSKTIVYKYEYSTKSHYPNFYMGCGSFSSFGCMDVIYLKYYNTSSWNYLSEIEEISYDISNSSPFKVVRKFLYNLDYLLPVEDREIYSDNNVKINKYFYPFNVPLQGLSKNEIQSIDDLKVKNRISEILWVKVLYNEKSIEERKYSLENFNNVTLPGSFFKKTSQVDFEKEVDILSYDQKANITEMILRGGLRRSYLWFYGQSYLVASVVNAAQSQISYTSFETAERGGWIYSGTPVAFTGTRTGRKEYNLGSGSVTKTGTGATSGNKFKLTFWARRPAGSGSWTFMGQTETLTANWKLIERIVETGSVTIGGSGIHIDELRLHPLGALMTTYTYDPLVGMTSKTDERNYTVYYEYDPMSRLRTVKDEDMNILEHFEYNYAAGN